LPLLLVLAAAVAATVAAAVVTGYLVLGSVVSAVLVLAWLAFSLRVRRAVVAWTGPGGDGPAPPGGAGVREPRRPRPHSPAGAAELPGDDGYPNRAVAIA
jgi:hypothetical protein